jgi:hypothetical protein
MSNPREVKSKSRLEPIGLKSGFSYADLLSSRTPGATTILVDEFDAGQFEGSPDNIKCRATRLVAANGDRAETLQPLIYVLGFGELF